MKYTKTVSRHRLLAAAIATATTLPAGLAHAAPDTFTSARSLGLAGTGVAIANPVDAASTNPARLAADQHNWQDGFGLMLPSVNARVAEEEEVIDQIDDIQDTINELDAAATGLNIPETQAKAGELRDQLQAFDRDTIRGNAGLGLAAVVPGKSLAMGVFANANLTATVRGEFDEADDARLAAIENGTLPPAGTPISDDLKSRGRILASAVTEVGIAFAREFELPNGEALQVGVSPKYVNLRTFQYTEEVDNFDEDDFDGSDFETEDSGFNLDLGVAYQFGDAGQWQTGAAVKNLIPMDLKSAAQRPDLGERERELKLDPRVTVGIAHTGDFHVVTAEADLTKTEAFGFEDDRQWLAVGAEFDAFRYAQLRVGVRHNLASNDDNRGIEEDTQFTAGVGLNLFGARLDLAALTSGADIGAAVELGAAF